MFHQSNSKLQHRHLPSSGQEWRQPRVAAVPMPWPAVASPIHLQSPLPAQKHAGDSNQLCGATDWKSVDAALGTTAECFFSVASNKPDRAMMLPSTESPPYLERHARTQGSKLISKLKGQLPAVKLLACCAGCCLCAVHCQMRTINARVTLWESAQEHTRRKGLVQASAR